MPARLSVRKLATGRRLSARDAGPNLDGGGPGCTMQFDLQQAHGAAGTEARTDGRQFDSMPEDAAATPRHDTEPFLVRPRALALRSLPEMPSWPIASRRREELSRSRSEHVDLKMRQTWDKPGRRGREEGRDSEFGTGFWDLQKNKCRSASLFENRCCGAPRARAPPARGGPMRALQLFHPSVVDCIPDLARPVDAAGGKNVHTRTTRKTWNTQCAFILQRARQPDNVRRWRRRRF